MRYYGQVRHRALDFGFIRSDDAEIEVYFRSLKPSDGPDAFALGGRVTFTLAFALSGPVAVDLIPLA